MFENEQSTNPTDDVIHSQEVEQEVQGQSEESLLNQSDADFEDVEEEADEVDIDGKKIAVPKSIAEKLRTERMLHADYTQKTQQLAEEKRAAIAEREVFLEEQRADMQDYARLVAVQDMIAEYNNVDWNQLIASDVNLAQQHQIRLMQLKDKAAQLEGTLEKRKGERGLKEQQDIAKQIQEASEYLAREINGWSKERSDQLLEYGVKQGLPPDFLTNQTRKTPAIGKLLHKAELYDRLMQKQAPKAAPVVQAKPAIKVGTNAPASKDPTRMSDSEFAAWRRKTQQSRKR